MNSRATKFGISILIPLILYLIIPVTETTTQPLVLFFVITIWAVIAWALEPIDSTAVAIVLPVLYFVMIPGIGIKAAMMAWAGGVPLICIGGFVLARMMMDTGVGQRIARICVKLSGGSFIGTILALSIASTILAPFIPTLTGKVVMLAVVAIGFCEALEFEKKSRNATIVMLTVLMSSSAARVPFITGSLDNAIGMQQLTNALTNAVKSGDLGESALVATDFTTFFVHQIIPALVFMVLYILIIVLILRPKNKVNFKQVAIDKLDDLGPITDREKKGMAILLLLLIGLVTFGLKLHPLNPPALMVLAAVLSFVPGIDLMDGESVKKVNFPALFFMVGALVIGAVGAKVGAPKWVTTVAAPWFESTTPFEAISLAYFSGTILSFMLTPLSALAALTQPIALMVSELGMDPRPIIYTFIYGLDQYFLPYEAAPFLFVYTSGFMNFKDTLIVFVAKFALTYVALISVINLYWRFVM